MVLSQGHTGWNREPREGATRLWTNGASDSLGQREPREAVTLPDFACSPHTCAVPLPKGGGRGFSKRIDLLS